MASKTHFKKLFNSTYLGAWDLDTDIILTIDSIKKESVNLPEGKKEDALVCEFKENSKPFILNKTNCKIISKVYGTRYIEDWIGKSIQVYATEVKAFGDLVDAIRIRPYKPKIGNEAKKADLNQKIIKALGNLPDEAAEVWKSRLKAAKATKKDTIPNLEKSLKLINEAI